MTDESPFNAVSEYIAAFNSGDAKAMASHFAASATILDGMPPHVWHGNSASDDWYTDVLDEGKHAGASGYLVTLSTPLHANVTGDSAYVVAPATMSFDLRCDRVTQTGAVFTVALRKSNAVWKIAAWAWAKGKLE
jgi:ketosteroid isomerase-like protein